MATTTERTVVFARSTFDRETRYFDGVKGDEPQYGQVEIVSKTIFERRADGDVGRLLEKWDTEEVLATLDAEGARHLSGTLINSIVRSLQVVDPARSIREIVED